MMDANSAATPRAFTPLPIIQFYSIEIAPNSDGQLFVHVAATLCEQDGLLENMDMASERVGSLDQALNAIREALLSQQQGDER